MDKKVVKRSLFSYIILFGVIIGMFFFINVLNTKVNDLTYNELLKALEDKEVTELTITPNSSQGIYSLTGKLKDYNENESFIVSATLSDETIKQIYDIKNTKKIKVNVAKDPGSSFILLFLVNVLPIALLIIFGYYFISKQMGSANKSMDFGRSRARLTDDKDKI